MKGLADLTASAWASDSNALFVSGHVSWGYTLLRVDVNGEIHSIVENHAPDVMAAVPSPDGRHLALFAAGDTGKCG